MSSENLVFKVQYIDASYSEKKLKRLLNTRASNSLVSVDCELDIRHQIT